MLTTHQVTRLPATIVMQNVYVSNDYQRLLHSNKIKLYHLATRLPVTIVIHNAYATHNTMVTNGLPLF